MTTLTRNAVHTRATDLINDALASLRAPRTGTIVNTGGGCMCVVAPIPLTDGGPILEILAGAGTGPLSDNYDEPEENFTLAVEASLLSADQSDLLVHPEVSYPEDLDALPVAAPTVDDVADRIRNVVRAVLADPGAPKLTGTDKWWQLLA